jgi:DNA-binding transcriptional LysR family regulator
MLDLIAHGIAIALLPKTAVESEPGICFVPLAEHSPTCVAAIVTADRPPTVATRTFLGLLDGDPALV